MSSHSSANIEHRTRSAEHPTPNTERRTSIEVRSSKFGVRCSPRLNWYPHPELNGDRQFRKLLLYPFELWGLVCSLGYRLPVSMMKLGGLCWEHSTFNIQLPMDVGS